MQTINEKPYKLSGKQKFEFLKRLPGFSWSYRQHPQEAIDTLTDSLKGTGIPEENIENVKLMLTALHATYMDRTFAYRIDRYLISGMGAVDLVLLTVVLPMGTSDLLLFLTLLFLAISLPLAGASLLVNFIKSEFAINTYGKVHSNLIFFSLLAGFASMATAFMHVSIWIGIIFICLATPLFFACAFYIALLKTFLSFFALQKSLSKSNSTPNQTKANNNDSQS